MSVRTVAALLLVAVLAGCADGGGALGSSPGPSGPGSAARSPLDLVGRWHVEGEGVDPGTALVLGEGLAVFLPCGVLDGAWEADGEQGLLIASADGGDSACSSGSARVPLPWLDRARRFDVDGEARTLLDADGGVLATLRPGARPTVGPDRSDDAAQEPEVTDALRARSAPVAALPDGVAPATAERLVRRWVPVGVEGTQAHLLLRADGSYTGSDGCNGQRGTWALGDEGRLLGTTGPQTLIACEGAPVGSWVDAAARAGLVDGDLVLHDPAGALLGRLAPG